MRNKNQKRAKFKQWGVLLISALLFIALAIPQNVKSAKVSRVIAPQINASVLTSLTNQTRAQNGLHPLNVNPTLVSAASAKVNDMFQKRYFAHTSPQGLTGWYFMRMSGYHYTKAGENLANGFITNQGLFNAWMQSPTHRANILNSQFKEIGIACKTATFNGETTTLTVQFFGIPQKYSEATEPSTGGNVLSAQTIPVYSPNNLTTITNQFNSILGKNQKLINKILQQIQEQNLSIIKIISQNFLS